MVQNKIIIAMCQSLNGWVRLTPLFAHCWFARIVESPLTERILLLGLANCTSELVGHFNEREGYFWDGCTSRLGRWGV